MDLDFSGKTVLVVGGSSGIGNGVAHGFRERGAAVHVWGTRASASDYDGVEGSDLTGLGYAKVDVGVRDEIAAARDHHAPRCARPLPGHGAVPPRRVRARGLGPGDGRQPRQPDGLRPQVPRTLAERKGVIIIVSSVSGYTSNRGNPAYAASKAGAISLTKTLGEAWAPEGIRVVGLAPGLVDTKLTKVTTENPQRLEASLRAIPLGRMGTPADMAGAALLLASPLAAYVVGQTLIVDGGLSL